MKIRWVLTLVMLGAMTTYAWDRPERVQVPQPLVTFDFGAVRQGQRVAHTFTIHNPLDEGVEISSVECNAPGMTARFRPMVPARTDREITLAWETDKAEGDMAVRAVVQFARGLQPATLVLKGRVSPPVEVLPSRISWFSLYRGEGTQKKLRVVNHDGFPLVVNRLQVQGEHFTASLMPSGQENEALIKLEIPDDLPVGRYQESLVLHTNHPAVSQLRLSVNVLIKEHLHANPEAVDFGRVDRSQLAAKPALGDLLTQTLMVKKRAGAFRITGISTDLPFLTLAPSPSGASAAFRIDVGLVTEKLKPGPIRGTIHVETDDREHPHLVLPVLGSVD
ncbi:MAG: hypothetical protein AB2A00_16890 [Myxococcota bacterium]